MALSSKASPPTITDVAAQAGVSIKTVSRVMNQEPGVHPQTREQVLKVVAALKYRPKLSARSLAGARSFLIGLLYYDPSAAFVGGVQQGATLRCREAGYHLVVESLHDDAPDLRQQVDRMVSALQPDGMILTPPLCDNAQVLKALRESHTPCVLISPARDVKGMASVRMDDAGAAEEITNLLISLGHERIAFIKGATDQAASGLRYQGYLRAMKTHRLAVDPELVHQGEFTFASGVEAAHHLLSRRTRPSAVFASNDDMATAILAVAHGLGLAIPGDVSVAGFDDTPVATAVWPELATIHQPIADMAAQAILLALEGLRRRREGEAASIMHRHADLELVERASIGVAPRVKAKRS